MTLPEQYAHDYRDMEMSEEELRKMLEEFVDEIRKERVTHCDDINCPECNKVAYEAGVKAERERCELRLRKEAKAHTHSKVAHGIAMYEKGKNNK